MTCSRTPRSAGRDVLLLSVAAFLTVLVLKPFGASLATQPHAPLPARFDSYIKDHVKLTAEKYTRLLAGQPVTQHLKTDPAKEVAIFGAVWVNAPMARYLTR